MVHFQELRSIFAVSLIFCFLVSFTFSYPAPQEEIKRPSLAIMIAVDDSEAGIFNRYSSFYTGVLSRLRQEEMNFTNTAVNHSMTISRPGYIVLRTRIPFHDMKTDTGFYKQPGEKWKYAGALENNSEYIPSGLDDRFLLLKQS